MPYIAATDADRAAMLGRIGAAGVEELFSDIPASLRFPKLDLPPALSEMEAMREIEALAAKNLSASSSAWFLGAGAYYHFIPAVVPALSSRGEFLTAYTPYQPEVSQGTLQAIFEYQSMAASLLGVEVVNASHYDGATALAEGLLMAYNAAGGAGSVGAIPRDRAILCADVHPEYKDVIRSYLSAYSVRLEESELPPEKAAALADASTFCVVAAYPGFSGAIGDIGAAARAAHAAGALLVVLVDPIMCGLLKSPGELGADIVAAEGQSLGNPMSFGGPFLGMLGTKAGLVRKMPGRLVGQAKDAAGRRGFVLTLTAREQHIRREKAVSNICSNQGLAMLQACIYLAAMGKTGLRAVAELCWNKAHYAASLIARVPGFAVEEGGFFKEFTVGTPVPAEELAVRLSRRGIVPGLPLSRYYPERRYELLVCVTEMCTKGQIELLARSLEEASA
ncbi:MAG: aminomethyl-transferring glycine dehydrogenase subunit GcvPA [Rectinemataceae bacterium]|jgi:glycine dehydrogenase subunit 1